jgi:hypothetical protein
MLSAEALDEILAGASFSIASEDVLLGRLLSLGDEYRPLLKWIEMRCLSEAALVILAEHFTFPPECVFCSVLDRLLPSPPAIADMESNPVGWSSGIVSDFPNLFANFKQKRFTLLWRGTRDGFRARDFHSRCDGHPNTLTVILDTNGNIFGGFTPVKWESRNWTGDGTCNKADPSLKSFIFTLKNLYNVPARKFALKAEKKDEAIYCYFGWGPWFSDIAVSDNCNATSGIWTEFGHIYTNDTGRDGKTFFAGSQKFQVKEIEVFEITE